MPLRLGGLGSGVSVRTLLDYPSLRGSRILAGAGGLDGRASWLVASDTPYKLSDLDVEDIVLAPAEAWQSGFSPEGAERMVRLGVVGAFSEPSASGSGIGSPISQVPIFRAFDRLSLPFIALSPGTGYRELSRALSELDFDDSKDPSFTPGKTPVDYALASVLDGIPEAVRDRLQALCFPPALRELAEWREIRAAVESYLRHRGNAVAAAAELGVHRHTVRSRISRYELLSGISLEDSQHRPLVELALLLSSRPQTGDLECPR